MELKFEIKRTHTGKDGTTGVFAFKGCFPFALTLERQWLDNKAGVSCIPEGTYTCKRVESPHFGNTFEVTDVQGRTHILFHKGNIDDDSHGCILVGEQFEFLGGSPSVNSSKHGYNEFMALTASVDTFTLEISNYF